MRHLPLFFLLILAVACQPKDILRDNAITKGETIHIPFDATAPAFPIDKIFKEYEFIALETNDSIFVRDLDYIPQIKTFGDSIYIVNWKEILIFNKKGSFLRKFDRHGPGPEEYNAISSFIVHPNGNITIIETWMAKSSILTYDRNGNLMDRFNMNELGMLWDISWLDESRLLLRTVGEREDIPDLIHLLDWRTREIVKNFYPIERSRGNILLQTHFAHYDNKYLFSTYKTMDVYELDEDSCLLRYTIDIGGKTPPKGFWQQERMDYLSILDEYRSHEYIGHLPIFMEGDQFLLMRYEGGSEELEGYAWVNKQDGKSGIFQEFQFEESFKWKPYYIFPQLDESIIIPIPAYLLFGKEGNTITQRYPKLHEESNPVLFIGKLR